MERFYFSHDVNASQDPKLKRAVFKHGGVALGIFWTLIEYLYQNDNSGRLDDIEWIAQDLKVEKSIVESVLRDFNLFVLSENDSCFYSLSIARRENKRKELSKTRAKVGRKGGQNRGRNEEAAETAAQGDEQDTQQTETEDATDTQEQNSQDEQEGGSQSREQEVKPNKKSKKFVLDAENLPQWLDLTMAEPFQTWIDYKRSRGSGYANEASAKMCYEKIVEWSGGDPNVAKQIVNTSIANNYQGLFPPEAKKAQNTNNMILHNSKEKYTQF